MLQPTSPENLPAEQSEETQTPVTFRNLKGQFVKGRSGNIKGRTLGSRNRAQLAKAYIEEALSSRLVREAEKLLQEAIRLALEGDEPTQVQMMKLLLGDVLKETRASPDGDLAAAGKKFAQAVQVNILHYHGEKPPPPSSPADALDGEFTVEEP